MKKMLMNLFQGPGRITALALFGFGIWCPVSVSAIDMLARGPYLQLSTPTNITVCWRTRAPIPGYIMYGTNAAALTVTNSSAVLETNHVFTLTNLEPDTKYYYAVGILPGGAPLAGPGPSYHFRTHPWPGTEKPMRVWVIGDAGTSSQSEGHPEYPGYQRAVRDAFVDFNGTNIVHAWLQLGDVDQSRGTETQYQISQFDVYPEQFRQWVTWPALGNHDSGTKTAFVDTYPYFGIFHLPTAGEAGGVPSGTEHWYSFDVGMAHFICLDSQTADRATNGAMATWLRADLAANTNRWTVAFWHHPPYTRGSYNSDGEPQLVEMRENFVPILEAGGVDLVLAGHSHVYERSYLIDGHYGLSSTFDTNTMVVQPGSGRETNGVGAYLKPDTFGHSPIGRRGTVYLEVGCSGKLSGGRLDHPVMYSSQNVLGSMVLDFASNRLDATFLPTNGVPSDWFSIIKEANRPPVANAATCSRNAGFSLKIAIEELATNWFDVDGDALELTGINPSTNGVTPTFDSSHIYYHNANDVADQFSYVISDGRGGDTNGIINVTMTPADGGQTMNILGLKANQDGSMTIKFAGVPGYVYGVQGTTNQPPSLLPPVFWLTLGTNTAGNNGLWEFVDTNAASYPDGRYYRSFKP